MTETRQVPVTPSGQIASAFAVHKVGHGIAALDGQRAS